MSENRLFSVETEFLLKSLQIELDKLPFTEESFSLLKEMVLLKERQFQALKKLISN